MLFMSIYKWEPEKRAEVTNRRTEKGAMAPPGMKIVGEWSCLAGGRVFRLVEVDDPRVMLQASMAWGDLGKIELFPVMETEEVMKLLPKQ